MVDGFQLIFIELQFRNEKFIALHQFRGRKAGRDPDFLRMVLNKRRDRVDRAVHRAAAKVRIFRFSFVIRGFKGDAHILRHTLILTGRNRDNRDPQHLFEFIHIDLTAQGGHLVDHVQGKGHGDVKLNQLQGQIKTALKAGRVDNI